MTSTAIRSADNARANAPRDYEVIVIGGGVAGIFQI